MAMPSNEISKTDFRNDYNIVRISNDIREIMKCLETFNAKNQVVVFAKRKQHKVTLEDIMSEIKGIKKDISDIKIRLLNVEEKLDRHEQLFKDHSWIK
ncbi:MAG: hypothetical protein ACOQNY_00590 [Mycoplasmoidaceae bacterium]